MIAAFRQSITNEDEIRIVRNLIPLVPSTEPSRFGMKTEEQGAALRATIFDPLLPAVGHHKYILIAPDGELARIPFEVLPTIDGRNLIDEYHISYLSTGRDVLRFEKTITTLQTQPVVVGDPDYDLSSDSFVNINEKSNKQLSRGLEMRHHFLRLHQTQIEAKMIAEMLNVQPLLGEAALESRLKSVNSPKILHIATHSFYLPISLGKGEEYNMTSESMILNHDRLRTIRGSENPLMRSGLALAGANTSLHGGSLPKEAEDGILTGEDILYMDLSNTELIVLSACDTGLGEVITGEGVFGLRRSFVLAGAQTLIMSLWKVPDEQTRELMVDFYQRLMKGQPRADALREAQLSTKKKYSNPYYWGAFICQGNPGPLTSKLLPT